MMKIWRKAFLRLRDTNPAFDEIKRNDWEKKYGL